MSQEIMIIITLVSLEIVRDWYRVHFGSIEVTNAAPQAAAPSGKEETIVAPMAGNILDVKVKVGDAVQKGQVVAILEAMKLENEVVATASGTVKQVLVSKGTAVTNQQAIIIVG